MSLTPTELSALAGIVISVAVNYVPGLAPWYDALTPTPKRLVMLAALAVAAVGVLVWTCRGLAACYGTSWETVLTAFVAALIANQATAPILPLSPERRVVRKIAAAQNEPKLPPA